MMDRIENRILIGITTFVGIMILVGWIAINEGGRMQAFEREFNARSVERGAALFTSNCVSCHGADARGIQGRAPALNNPQLFGFDYFADIDGQTKTLTEQMKSLEAELVADGTTDERILEIHTLLGTGSIAAEQYAEVQAAAVEAAAEATEEPATTGAEATEAAPTTEPTVAATPTLEATPTTDSAAAESTAEMALDSEAETAAEVIVAQTPLQAEQATLQAELTDLQAEIDAGGVTEDRSAEIAARMAEIAARLGTDSIPAQLLALSDQRNTLMGQMQATLEKGYDPTKPSRLDNLGWAGGLEAFIYTTLIHGRPLSGEYWPQGQTMPPWSQLAGGPLRTDQLQDLTNYILNFDKGDNWTLDDLFAINQFAIVPGGAPGSTVENPVCAEPSSCDILAVVAQLDTLTGDPQNGQTLYNNFSLSCIGCHGPAHVGPALEGTYTRAVDVRLNLPQFAGYTPEQYFAESILLPNAYKVPSYEDRQMPLNFGQKLDIQMLADLIAYLESQDGPSPE